MSEHLLRTNADNEQFKSLVIELDKYLAICDGEDHAFYAQYNTLETIHHVLLIVVNDCAVSCGALKPYSSHQMEVKRMFTLPTFRGQGMATKILKALEQWSVELSYKTCILETGVKQIEAIKLYERLGYQRISNYGQYEHVATSICFEKQLT